MLLEDRKAFDDESILAILNEVRVLRKARRLNMKAPMTVAVAVVVVVVAVVIVVVIVENKKRNNDGCYNRNDTVVYHQARFATKDEAPQQDTF